MNCNQLMKKSYLLGSAQLTDINKVNSLNISQKLLKRYENERNSFLNGVICLDESWTQEYTTNFTWKHLSSLTAKNSKHTLLWKNLWRQTIFCDWRSSFCLFYTSLWNWIVRTIVSCCNYWNTKLFQYINYFNKLHSIQKIVNSEMFCFWKSPSHSARKTILLSISWYWTVEPPTVVLSRLQVILIFWFIVRRSRKK